MNTGGYYLEEGTIITCPECQKKIAVTKKRLYKGEPIMASSFEGIDQDIVPFGLMLCRGCSHSYYENGKIHTEHGWKI